MEQTENADSTRAREILEEIRDARNQGRDDLAFTRCGECLYLAKRAGDRKVEARALLIQADLIFHYNPTGIDPFSQRMTLGEQALDICREIGDNAGASACLRLLASIHAGEKGQELLREALDLAESSGELRQVADTLERMAANSGLRDSTRAIELAERALALYREIDDLPGKAQALFGLSIQNIGPNRIKSREYALEALEVYRRLEHKKPIAQMLMFLWVGERDNYTEEREAALLEGRETCHEIGVACWEASFMEELAAFAEARGDVQKAVLLRVEAAKIDDSPKLNSEEMKALEEAFESGDPEKAEGVIRGAFVGGGNSER